MNRKIKIIVLLVMSMTMIQCDVKTTQLPPSLQNCLTKETVVPFSDEQISSSCLLQFLWENRKLCGRVSNETLTWLESLVNMAQSRNLRSGNSRKRRQAVLRRRMEYRMLSNQERNDYHRAINLMKSDTSVFPNKYDGFVNYHSETRDSAHKGVAFAGWHRFFLVLYELALQEKVASVMLPYWDFTLDREMKNPVDSVIFTDLFLGKSDNENGEVISGPFGHWRRKIIRSVGKREIAKRSYIEQMIERSPNQRRFVADLESVHDHVHSWVGGDMAFVGNAPRDPIFYMHHAFIDCVWEMYRDREKRLGRNPEIYPQTNDTLHDPNVIMLNLTINGVFQRNADGYKNFWTEIYYTCAPFPSCSFVSPDCGSEWLQCNVFGDTARCESKGFEAALPQVTDSIILEVRNALGVPSLSPLPPPSLITSSTTSRKTPLSSNSPRPDVGTSLTQLGNVPNIGFSEGIQTSGRRKVTGKDFFKTLKQIKTSGNLPLPASVASGVQHDATYLLPASTSTFTGDTLSGKLKIPEFERSCVGEPTQNKFNVDCDIGTPLWSFLPFKIIHLRHGEIKYPSYSVDINGNIINAADVYSIGQQLTFATNTQAYIRANKRDCKFDKSGLTSILVSSYGLNYEGIYQDNVFVDNRRTLSSEISYIGIKTPRNGTTKVFLTATDECGIACQPMVQRRRKPLRYDPFPGAVEISTNGHSYHSQTTRGAEALVWIKRGKSVPTLKEKNIPIVFYCDYRENNPWS